MVLPSKPVFDLAPVVMLGRLHTQLHLRRSLHGQCVTVWPPKNRLASHGLLLFCAEPTLDNFVTLPIAVKNFRAPWSVVFEI